jgi:hypothetical protein
MLLAVARRISLGTAIGGAAIFTSRAAVHAAAAPPPDAALGDLWAGAVDGMISVPGTEAISTDGVLYMAPAPAQGKVPPKYSVEWPRIFSKGVVFSLTASNPMGMDAPHEENVEANSRLEADIKSIRPEARAWWHSFGFHEKEGWREDGFSIAFSKDERMFARDAVLRLARRYKQAAIYVYHTNGEGQLVRTVLWCDSSKQATHGSQEIMVLLRKPPRTALAAKDWQPEA